MRRGTKTCQISCRRSCRISCRIYCRISCRNFVPAVPNFLPHFLPNFLRTLYVLKRDQTLPEEIRQKIRHTRIESKTTPRSSHMEELWGGAPGRRGDAAGWSSLGHGCPYLCVGPARANWTTTRAIHHMGLLGFECTNSSVTQDRWHSLPDRVPGVSIFTW